MYVSVILKINCWEAASVGLNCIFCLGKVCNKCLLILYLPGPNKGLNKQQDIVVVKDDIPANRLAAKVVKDCANLIRQSKKAESGSSSEEMWVIPNKVTSSSRVGITLSQLLPKKN